MPRNVVAFFIINDVNAYYKIIRKQCWPFFLTCAIIRTRIMRENQWLSQKMKQNALHIILHSL